MGQYLNARRYISSLIKTAQTEVQSRTQVYGLLIRRFGHRNWVEQVDLIPRTLAWKNWQRLVGETKEDPKELYERCLHDELTKGEEESEGLCEYTIHNRIFYTRLMKLNVEVSEQGNKNLNGLGPIRQPGAREAYGGTRSGVALKRGQARGRNGCDHTIKVFERVSVLASSHQNDHVDFSFKNQ
jgi:hypothetical protein